METRWVIRRFSSILQKSWRYDDDPPSITLSLSSMKLRRIAHEKTLNKMESSSGNALNGGGGVAPNNVDEINERMVMQRTLAEGSVFDAFMRHLLKEYSYECLLGIVE